MGASVGSDSRALWLSWGAIGVIIIFNVGWIVAGALQTGGYSVARDDVSDLGALSANDASLSPIAAAPLAYVPFERKTGGGLLQRLSIVLLSVAVSVLALWVGSLARSEPAAVDESAGVT